MVVFINSTPSNCKVVLATSRRIWLHQGRVTTLAPPHNLYLYVRMVSHLNTFTHSSSVHILKIVAVVGRILTKEKRGTCLVLVCIWCFGLSLGIVLEIYY
jgi:hypothetical protein